MKKIIALLLLSCILLTGCEIEQGSNVSASGVHRAVAKVETGKDGLTTEQRNISQRIKMDNDTGAVKHLYIISAYSGQTLLYSTVNGKVTSSGKRLTPKSVAALEGEHIGSTHNGMPVNIGGQTHYTSEVLQDDGTYGESIEYLYWFDSRGIYHQHYVNGGQIVHISDQPITVRDVIINLETHDIKTEDN